MALHVGAVYVPRQGSIWVTKSCGYRAQRSPAFGSVDQKVHFHFSK